MGSAIRTESNVVQVVKDEASTFRLLPPGETGVMGGAWTVEWNLPILYGFGAAAHFMAIHFLVLTTPNEMRLARTFQGGLGRILG